MCQQRLFPMARLPILSGREILKVFLKCGYERTTHEGSHVTLKKVVGGKAYLVTVPLYDDIATGLLLRIIRQSDMTREQFLAQLKQ